MSDRAVSAGPGQLSAARPGESALHYAARGWLVLPVFPIRTGRCACRNPECGRNTGKHPVGPLVPNGLHDATTDVELIRRWWQSWPDANIAIRTGVESGLWVVDLDPEKGGTEAWAQLTARFGMVPETVEAITGGLGRHLYFRHPGPGIEVRNSAGVLGSGVDVRGDSGYVVAPPSGHRSGRTYEWKIARHPDEIPLAAAPAWLLQRALAGTPTSAEGNGNGHRTAEDWAALLQGAPDGRRHDVAVRIAGHFLGLGIAPVEVEQVLLGFAARCTPPADPEKLRCIVRDLASKDAAKTGEQGLGLVPVGGAARRT